MRFCGDNVVSDLERCDVATSPNACAPGCLGGRELRVDTGGPGGPGLCSLMDAGLSARDGTPRNGCVFVEADPPSPVDVIRFAPNVTEVALDDVGPLWVGDHGLLIDGGGAVTIGGSVASDIGLFVSLTGALTLRGLAFEDLDTAFVLANVAELAVLRVERSQFTGLSGDTVLVTDRSRIEIADSTFADGCTALTLSGGSGLVERSTFSGNTGPDRGAINATNATLTVYDSTFVDNRGQHQGGAIGVATGTVVVRGSTFVGNRATVAGATLSADGNGNSIDLATSIIEPFDVGSAISECSGGPYTNGSYLAFSDATRRAACGGDPATSVIGAVLTDGTLADNGGLTPTIALPRGSVALNVVPLASCRPRDQRGVTRAGERCDIGAFEAPLDSFALALDAASEVYVPAGTGAATFAVDVAVSLLGAASASSVVVTCDLDGATFVTASGALSGRCSPSGGDLTCALGALAAPTTLVSGTLTLDARAATGAAIDLSLIHI